MIAESHAMSTNSVTFSGIFLGLFVFLILEKLLPHVHLVIRKKQMSDSKKKAALVAGTVTIHNIPEGFAIASAFAGSSPLGWLVTTSIALQDIPEGLMISTPLACYGLDTRRCFGWGAFSGVVEFVAAVVGYLFLSTVKGVTPFALSFSAGAMSYVVLFELLPDAFNGNRHIAAISFIAGIAVAFGLATLLGF
jgi:ZIP family zinc transporter